MTVSARLASRRRSVLALLCLLGASGCVEPIANRAADRPSLAYEKRQVMIPMRDGVRLNTEIYVPRRRGGPLPILFNRTPYGLRHDDDGFHGHLSTIYRELAQEGYVFVFQDIRGRYDSEGEFVMMRPPRDPARGETVDEGTDAWDTIEWLLANVEGHNGRIGMLGISYGGWLTAMALVEPHPALAAASPQASPSDMFLGDDFFHNGAFRLAPGFGYVAMMERGRTSTPFRFDQRDAYEWYLDLGPLSEVDARTFGGAVPPTWADFASHPNYDEYWKRQETSQYLSDVPPPVPVLNVAGWWDAEDHYGPMRIYQTLESRDREHRNYLVVGPWRHGGWARDDGSSLGDVDFGTATGEFFRREVQAPFFAHFLKDRGSWVLPEALTFQTGSNEWEHYETWPPRGGVREYPLYFHPQGRLSFDPPTDPAGYDEYLSDPSDPVPYWSRPVPGFWQGGQALWKVADQRFAHRRPDVVTWESEPLEGDLILSGPISARLFASTTGTDADWIVKLIDAYPEDYAEDPEMGGYQLMIADEVLRARFRNSYEHPEAVPADQVVDYVIDLGTRNHVFRQGHRVMVQVQSTWFPLIDRNPQTFVENIFEARAEDFRTATQRIFRSTRHPSHIVLTVGRR